MARFLNTKFRLPKGAVKKEFNSFSEFGIKQQQQSALRLREPVFSKEIALNNQLKVLLLEFNIRRYRKGFSCRIKQTLDTTWKQYSQLPESI